MAESKTVRGRASPAGRETTSVCGQEGEGCFGLCVCVIHIQHNSFQVHSSALAGVAQLEHHPTVPNVVGLIPSHGNCLGCGCGPPLVGAYVRGNQSMSLSLSSPFAHIIMMITVTTATKHTLRWALVYSESYIHPHNCRAFSSPQKETLNPLAAIPHTPAPLSF